MSRSIRCGLRRNEMGFGVPSGSGWGRAPPPRRARSAAGRSWPFVVLPISPADDVSVALAVPRGGSDTSGAKNILADPTDNDLWQLAEDLHVARYGEVRHPCTAKVQQLRVIQGAVRSHGDEKKDVVFAQAPWTTTPRMSCGGGGPPPILPTDPCGSGSPSESTIRTSKLGFGRPDVPGIPSSAT